MTHKESRELRRKIWEAMSGGKSRSEVIREFGVSIYFVARAMSEYGHIPDSGQGVSVGGVTGTLKRSTFHIIAAMLNTKDSHSDIAKRFNVSKQRISQIHKSCVEAGIPVN